MEPRRLNLHQYPICTGWYNSPNCPITGMYQKTGEVMPRMKAAIFVEPGRIVLDEKPIPDVGPLDALIRITTTTICGTDVHILKGEYPVARGPDDRARTGRRDRKAGIRRPGLYRGPARDRGRHLPERTQPRLAVRLPFAGRRRDAAWLEAAWRLEVRQHDRWLSGRVRAGAGRHGQPRSRTGWPDRRGGPDVPRHHVHGLLRAPSGRGSRSATPSRYSPRDRSACAPRPAPSCAAPPR